VGIIAQESNPAGRETKLEKHHRHWTCLECIITCNTRRELREQSVFIDCQCVWSQGTDAKCVNSHARTVQPNQFPRPGSVKSIWLSVEKVRSRLPFSCPYEQTFPCPRRRWIEDSATSQIRAISEREMRRMCSYFTICVSGSV
jgi:hypothetical protein